MPPIKNLAKTAFAIEQEVQRCFDAWVAAVGTGTDHAEELCALYAPDAVLLPTLSPVMANTPRLRRAYFTILTALDNLSAAVEQEYLRVYGDTAVTSGLYTFTFTENDTTATVPARFSFVYRRTATGWLIVDHHSSRLPAERRPDK